jgi:hypothetical protein
MHLKLTDWAALFVAAVTIVWGRSAVKPKASVIPAPAAEHQATVAPITAILAGHKDQASQLAAYFHSAADTVRRDGTGAKVLKSTSQLRTFFERAETLRFQGAFDKVPGLSDAIHGPNGALAKLLKLDVAELDHARAADALDGVAWACQEAAK